MVLEELFKNELVVVEAGLKLRAEGGGGGQSQVAIAVMRREERRAARRQVDGNGKQGSDIQGRLLPTDAAEDVGNLLMCRAQSIIAGAGEQERAHTGKHEAPQDDNAEL